MKQYIEAGKIVSTHGIKGEVKVQPWCDSPDFIVDIAENAVLYFDKGEKEVEVTSARVMKNMTVLKINGIDTPEEAVKVRNKILYVNRDDIELDENSYFITDLIGLEVLDADDNSVSYGTIIDVTETGANDVYHIKSQEGKVYLIPAIKKVVVNTCIDENKMYIRPLKGLFDDEN